MSEDRYTRITLRIPKELDERLSNEADKTSKSKNAEIVHRLEESFNDSVVSSPSETDKLNEIIVKAFQNTSDDFSEEVTRRLGQFVVLCIENDMRSKGINPETYSPPATATKLTEADKEEFTIGSLFGTEALTQLLGDIGTKVASRSLLEPNDD